MKGSRHRLKVGTWNVTSANIVGKFEKRKCKLERNNSDRNIVREFR